MCFPSLRRNAHARLEISHAEGSRTTQALIRTTPHQSSDRAKAGAAGQSWPLLEGQDDAVLERLLFPVTAGDQNEHSGHPDPEMLHIRKELRNKHVTLQLLWHEYKDTHPNGYQYSQFCERYQVIGIRDPCRWPGGLFPHLNLGRGAPDMSR